MQVKPVILSGGSGTRLWPMSHPSFPKQLLKLVGDDTMFQATVRRTLDHPMFLPATIVASDAHEKIILNQLAEIGTEIGQLILEPIARNTAPAIALAALASNPTDLLLVMPSDHIIDDFSILMAAVDVSLPVAAAGRLITFGVRPTRPETGFGYIKRGPQLAPAVFEVAQFVEKPDDATAESYLRAGTFYWNSGIFLFSAAAYISALERLAPEVMTPCRRAMDTGLSGGQTLRPSAHAFERAPSISIDKAVLEREADLAVTALDLNWSDLGSWESLYEASRKDNDGNAVLGDVVTMESENCLLRSDGPKLAAIGLKGIAVIATSESILVVPLAKSQRVRELVENLERSLPAPIRGSNVDGALATDSTC